MVWGIEIVLYLFLAGVGAGTLATTILTTQKHKDVKFLPVAGSLAALACVGVGLLLLMIDAKAGFHHPLRFFYLISNLSSVMAWGVIILSFFMIFGLIWLVMAFLGKEHPRFLNIICILLCIGTATYTGALLGVVQARPLWNNIIILPILFLVSATSTGVALAFLVAFIGKRKECEAIESSTKWHTYLPIFEGVLIIIWLILTKLSGDIGAQSVHNLLIGSYAIQFWILFVLAAIVIPIILPLVGRRGKGAQFGGDTVVAITSVSSLIGGFMLRYLVVFASIALILGA